MFALVTSPTTATVVVSSSQWANWRSLWSAASTLRGARSVVSWIR
jgi:hypothetical protein